MLAKQLFGYIVIFNCLLLIAVTLWYTRNNNAHPRSILFEENKRLRSVPSDKIDFTLNSFQK